MKDRTKKTTPVHINLDLHKQAKLAAIDRNISLQELVEKAIENTLKRSTCDYHRQSQA